MNFKGVASAMDDLSLLVVEDGHVVAQEICMLLDGFGCKVVGPAPTVDRARKLAETEAFHGALLDVNLHSEDVYPLADDLLVRSIPFVFMTGYDADTLPEEFRNWPNLEKPFAEDDLRYTITRHFISDPEPADSRK